MGEIAKQREKRGKIFQRRHDINRDILHNNKKIQ